ncbi:MAG: hypothetical protein ACI837_002962 [Crocinitomicaceae bacterium]|jgi:hypothetical protein
MKSGNPLGMETVLINKKVSSNDTNLNLMKLIFLSTFILASTAMAQLSEVTAYGTDDKYVDWAQEEANQDPDGPGYFYHDCAQGVQALSASSTLAPQGKFNYDTDNLMDSDPKTAWVEGVKGYGIGESFSVMAMNVSQIYNGYQHSIQVWKDNSRVKRFLVYLDDDPLCYLDLLDVMGAQYFELPVSSDDMDWDNQPTFTFEIVEVYKGLKWDDVAISHIDDVRCCFAANTTILSSLESMQVDQLEAGQEVTTLNLITGETLPATVIKSTMQKHVSLIEISTDSHTIQMTKDHPVFVKGFGFISMSRLLKMKNAAEYNELIGAIEFMVWDEAAQATKFESLKAIKIKEGLVDTYSIMQLSEGSSFIANGFVTKTY